VFSDAAREFTDCFKLSKRSQQIVARHSQLRAITAVTFYKVVYRPSVHQPVRTLNS